MSAAICSVKKFSILLMLLCSSASAGNTHPLIDAVKSRDATAVHKLIEQNVDVNTPQADGATALHWAVHRNEVEIVKALLEAGAKVDAQNDFGVVPLSLACENQNRELAELLLQIGADPNTPRPTGETLLMTAAYAGDSGVVEALLEHGADPNLREPVRQQTALMWALGQGHSEVAMLLIKNDADIHATTTLGFTPLLFAAREGNLELTKVLLDAGADLSVIAKHRDNQTYLAERDPDNDAEKLGLSVLQVATIRGHADVAMYLLEQGADPNYDGPGYTALHWAVTSWETEMNGVNGFTAPKGHEWSRISGIQEGKLELVQALLDHGADINAKLVSNPSRYGFTVTSTRPAGSTPYALAAMAADADMMRLLVRNGADPTIIPGNGVPPLLWAAGVNRHTAENIATEDQSLEAVIAAIEHGADINSMDTSKNTAMHGAAWIRSPKIVQYLVDHGADVNAKNKYQLSALDIATTDGRLAGVPGPFIESSPVVDLLLGLSDEKVIKKAFRKKTKS